MHGYGICLCGFALKEEMSYFIKWPDLAKFRHFGNMLKVFGNCLRVYLAFGKIFCFLADFHCCKWPKIEQMIYPSGYTD